MLMCHITVEEPSSSVCASVASASDKEVVLMVSSQHRDGMSSAYPICMEDPLLGAFSALICVHLEEVLTLKS